MINFSFLNSSNDNSLKLYQSNNVFRTPNGYFKEIPICVTIKNENNDYFNDRIENIMSKYGIYEVTKKNSSIYFEPAYYIFTFTQWKVNEESYKFWKKILLDGTAKCKIGQNKNIVVECTVNMGECEHTFYDNSLSYFNSSFGPARVNKTNKDYLREFVEYSRKIYFPIFEKIDLSNNIVAQPKIDISNNDIGYFNNGYFVGKELDVELNNLSLDYSNENLIIKSQEKSSDDLQKKVDRNTELLKNVLEKLNNYIIDNNNTNSIMKNNIHLVNKSNDQLDYQVNKDISMVKNDVMNMKLDIENMKDYNIRNSCNYTTLKNDVSILYKTCDELIDFSNEKCSKMMRQMIENDVAGRFNKYKEECEVMNMNGEMRMLCVESWIKYYAEQFEKTNQRINELENEKRRALRRNQILESEIKNVRRVVTNMKNLYERVDNMEQRIEDAEKFDDEISDELKEMYKDIKYLKKDMREMDYDIDDISYDVKKWKESKEEFPKVEEKREEMQEIVENSEKNSVNEIVNRYADVYDDEDDDIILIE